MSDISKTVAHLYETEHDCEGQTENLVPKEYSSITVADGEFLTSSTLTPFLNRDLYLANQIGYVYDALVDKYQGSDSVYIDKEKWTLNALDMANDVIFTSGLTYNTFTNTLSLKLSTDYNNNLKLDNNRLYYNVTATGTHTTAEKEIIKEENYPVYTNVKQSDSIIDSNVIVVNYEQYAIMGNKSYSGEDHNVSSINIFRKSKNSQTTESITANTALSSSGGILPMPWVPFQPNKHTPIKPGNVQQDAINYINPEKNINMCPTGTLYLWRKNSEV